MTVDASFHRLHLAIPPSKASTSALSTRRYVMPDLVFLAIVAAFFVAAVLYVRGCAALVGNVSQTLTPDGRDVALDENGDEVIA